MEEEPIERNPEEEAPDSAPGHSLLSLAPLPLAALILVVGLVQLPVLTLEPGEARDVGPLIDVRQEDVYESKGDFILTTVSYRYANAMTAALAWLDPVSQVVPPELIFAPGVSEEENEEIVKSEMDGSKLAAAYVALARLTAYPEEHGDGVLIKEIFGGTPADGKLFPGDLIVEVDGAKPRSVDWLGERIRSTPEGRAMTFEVEAGGKSRSVKVTPRAVDGSDRPVIGFTIIDNFPFPISISSGDIGGPSAGLMWTLGLYDLLTPGDLTGGRRIAGTGTMDLGEGVGPIGGVKFKVAAAEKAGATVFLVPEANYDEALDAGSDIDLVRVGTLDDALDYLASSAS